MSPVRQQDLNRAVKDVDRLLSEQAGLRRAQMVLGERIGECGFEIRGKLRKVLPMIESPYLGGCSCPTSPFKMCVYDNDDDPMHDDCIYCHDPEERK